MATNVTFGGTSPEECETFLATVHREALAKGKYTDERWITFYAASLLRGEALVFYENLDGKTKANWADIRTLFVNKYIRTQKEIPSPSNAMPTPAATPPNPARKGRIAVVRDNQQKLYLSSKVISSGDGLKLCNSPSEAQIVSFAASGTDLFEMRAGDISSDITLCVQWPGVSGDNWVDIIDCYACIKSSTNQGSGIAQAKVWSISNDNSLLVRYSHARGTRNLDPVESGEKLHLAQNADNHCGKGQGTGYRKAVSFTSILPESSVLLLIDEKRLVFEPI